MSFALLKFPMIDSMITFTISNFFYETVTNNPTHLLYLIMHPVHSSLVALVLNMSRTCPGLVPNVPVVGQNNVFMGTQDRLQNVSHGSVTCPSCPATRLCQSRTKTNRASH